jgi:hypothetical protein
MGRIQVIHGSREELIKYLRRRPEAHQFTLIAAEGECPTVAPPQDERQRNGVPLFPELPQMTPVTPETIRQLIDEETAL